MSLCIEIYKIYMVEKNSLLDKLMIALDDIQAIDIVTLDVKNITAITDYMIICSGRSSTHVKAIAENIMENMKKNSTPAISATGLENGEWVLVDFGDFVVHIMQPERRAFYNLEGLWQE